MKFALFVFLVLNTVNSWASDEVTQAHASIQTYKGVVSNATGSFARHNDQSCVIKVSQIDSEKIQFSVSINHEPTGSQIRLTRGGSDKLLTAAVSDFSGPGIKSSEACSSEWSRGRTVDCESEVEHSINVRQNSESQITHIEYKRYKNLSEVGGLVLASYQLECQLTLSAE